MVKVATIVGAVYDRPLSGARRAPLQHDSDFRHRLLKLQFFQVPVEIQGFRVCQGFAVADRAPMDDVADGEFGDLAVACSGNVTDRDEFFRDMPWTRLPPDLATQPFGDLS